MKPISARQIAVVFTGSFLGAGFLSGQELLQFFGVFGGFGLVGMALLSNISLNNSACVRFFF